MTARCRVLLIFSVCLFGARPGSADEPRAGVPDDTQQRELQPLSDVVITGLEQPLLIRFHVSVGGKAWREHFDDVQRRFLQAVFAQLDADGNGTLSATEAKRLPPPRAWASLAGGDDVYVAFNFRILDDDGDGAATPAELERYLKSFGDIPVRWQTVPAGRSSDDLFRLLDADRDGALVASEWQAVAKLGNRDRDGDRVLTAEELRGMTPVAMPPEFVAAGPRGGTSRKPLAFELKPAGGASAALDVFIDYPSGAAARRPAVRVASAPGTVLEARLDLVGADEPVLVIAGRRIVLRVPPAPAGTEAAMRQQLLSEYAALAERTNNQVTASTAAPPLLKSTFGLADRNDDGTLEREELEAYLEAVLPAMAAADAARLRFVKYDERPGLMSAADLNLDGRLSRRELASLPQRLASIAGAAGRIARDEFPATIALVLQHGPFGDSTDPNVLENAGPPWFFRADRNRDGDLDREEFLGDPADFERLDANKDGWIDLDEAILAEIPESPARPGGN